MVPRPLLEEVRGRCPEEWEQEQAEDDQRRRDDDDDLSSIGYGADDSDTGSDSWSCNSTQ